MKTTYIWILLLAGAIVAFLFYKRRPPATSATARATTAATTTGRAPQAGIKSPATTGSAGWAGWLTQGQNVLQSGSNNVKSAQDAGAAIRNLGGTFANLWGGGGGPVSSTTSGSGAGVPVNYDSPGPSVNQNDGATGDYSGGNDNYWDFSGGDSYGSNEDFGAAF